MLGVRNTTQREHALKCIAHFKENTTVVKTVQLTSRLVAYLLRVSTSLSISSHTTQDTFCSIFSLIDGFVFLIDLASAFDVPTTIGAVIASKSAITYTHEETHTISKHARCL